MQRMLIASLFLLYFSFSTFGGSAAAAEVRLPAMSVVDARLPNGLRVFVEEDHRCHRAAVEILYRVGEAADPPGRPGLADLIQKLMEHGATRELDDAARFDMQTALGVPPFSAEIGTTVERTTVRVVGPSYSLPMMLWTEANRMASLAAGILPHDVRRFGAELEDSIHQRRADTVPLLLARARSAFWNDHPYARVVPVDIAPLRSVTASEIRDRLTSYYTPANATVAIVGDVKAADAIEWVKRYFAPIPAGEAKPFAPAVPSGFEGTHTIEIAAKVDAPSLFLAWPTPKEYEDADFAFDLAARILTERLRQKLTIETVEASEAWAAQASLISGSTFFVRAVAAPDHDGSALLPRIDAELERLRTEGPSDAEVEFAHRRMVLSRLTDEDGLKSRASALNTNAFGTGDPAAQARIVERYQRLSGADIRTAVRTYLLPRTRVVEWIRPDSSAPLTGVVRSGLAPAPKPASAESPRILETTRRAATPAEPPPAIVRPAVAFEPPRAIELRTSNGPRVRVIERHAVPEVHVSLVLPWDHAPPVGRTLFFMDSILWRAKARGSQRALVDELIALGATVHSEADLDATVLTFTVLTGQLEEALGMVRRFLAGRTLDTAAVERARDRWVKSLATAGASTKLGRYKDHYLFPKNHRYWVDADGGESGMAHLSAQDLARFLDREIRPASAMLDVVGDVTAERLGRLLGASATPRPAESTAKPPTLVPWNKGIFLVDDPSLDKVELLFAMPLGDNSSSNYPVEAVQSLLVPQWSPSNDLNDKLKAGQVSSWSGARARNIVLRDRPHMIAQISVEPKDLVGTIRGYLGEIDAIHDGKFPTSRAERYGLAVGAWLEGLYDPESATLDRLDVLATRRLAVDADGRVMRWATARDQGELTAAARQYIGRDEVRIFALGKIGDAASQLAKLGIEPVEVSSVAQKGASR
jgi:zinc protease